MKEKGTSILIETKDQRKEEREKREKQENWRERDITKERSKNIIRRGASYSSMEEASDLRTKNMVRVSLALS